MRKSFVSLLSNDRYQVGCTGQTVYVLDSAGNELARFRDMIYAYYAALHPDGNTAAIFSNKGLMAIYSLLELRLIKKFRVSAVCDTQTDCVPCFSLDGKYLYHIEGRKGDSLNSRLSVYSTIDYQPVLRLFEHGPRTVFTCIEIDKKSGCIFLLGYFRKDDYWGSNDYFVARLIDQSLQDIRIIDDHRIYEFYRSAVHLKQRGYTQDCYNYYRFSDSYLSPFTGQPIDMGPFNHKYTLYELKQLDFTLSQLWESPNGFD